MNILNTAMADTEDIIAADDAESSEKNSIIERLLMRIRSTDDFPTISKHLIEINKTISGDTDKSDASDLAGVILRDYALTNKLLKLVNSAYYGFASGNVSTITRAVVLLGYEHVRMATMRLTLFEHFKSKNPAQDIELRETIVMSFWAGVLARDIATMDKVVDPEEAFVCAMLGQLGKLLMIYYLPGEYAKIRSRMERHNVDEATAVKAECRIVYEELGVAVAKQWNFPVHVYESMIPVSDRELKDKQKSPSKLQVLSSFVKDLCTIVQVNAASPNPAALKRLIERYKPHIVIDKKQLQKLSLESLEHMVEQAQALDVSYGKSAFLEQLVHQFDQGGTVAQPLAPPVAEREILDILPSVEKTVVSPIENGLSAEQVILGGIQEISQTMMDTYEVNDIVSMGLEIIFRALNFDRALMFIREPGSRMMTVRFGYGKGANTLSRHLGFQAGTGKDIFNLAIHVGKDLIIGNIDDDRMHHLIPAWYRDHLNAPAFLFLPIMLQKVCVGAFYADRNEAGMPINESEHRHLSMLRNQLTLAIKFRR